MNEVYIRKLNVRSELVDYRKKMTFSSFMNLFQQCCIAHTEELGMGKGKTLDKGFLWVIISEHILINRMPEYDENIILECTPGMTLHYFFPRNIIVKNEAGEVLIRANALWSLIDKNTRQFIDPAENDIIINGRMNPTDVIPVVKLKVPELHNKKMYTANYSLVDINGHLSNTHYMSIMCDTIYANGDSLDFKEITILFKKEIPINKKFAYEYERIDDNYYFKSKYFEAKFN